MAQDFRAAYLELVNSEIFDRLYEVLVKESAEIRDFLKSQKLFSDSLKASEVMPLVKSSGKIDVPKDINDFWNWSPVKALEYVENEFVSVGYPVATLKMYIKNNTKTIYEHGLSDVNEENCLGKVLNKSFSANLSGISKQEIVDALNGVEIKDWQNVLIEKFTDDIKEKGIEEDDFVEAVKFINTLSYAWKSLALVSSVPCNDSNTSAVPIPVLAEIYAGHYSAVPDSEPVATEIYNELITDKSAFEQLSKQKQLQVSHFLCANFAKLNNILLKYLQRIYDTFNLITKTDFENELKEVVCGSSIYDNNEPKKVFEEIKNNIGKFIIEDRNTGMNGVLYGYIPVLMKYKNSKNFNKNLANNMIYYKTLKVIGVADKIEEPVRSYAKASVDTLTDSFIGQSLMGGAKQKFKGGFDRFGSKDDEFRIYKPNSSTGKYLKELRELQIDYNNKFVGIYREILNILDNIKQEEINQIDNIKAATIIGQFEKILISSNRTTVYLSGILPTKNYSKQFIDATENLAKLCNNIGGCFKQLEEPVYKFVKLGKETITRYQKIRSVYLESAKDASEMLINSENIDAFKVKCDLKKEDFIRKIDACKRISAMCNNRSGVKMGVSTAEMLKKYISGMTDRDKMITEYFDSYESGIKYILSQTYKTEDLAIIKPLISMKMILVDETKKAYLWLNQYLDKFLVDKRIEQLGKASLDKQTVDKVANAFVEFKKYSRVGLEELVRKYKNFLSSESISTVSVNSYFKLFKLAKQTFEEVDAFTYMEKLYNELGITDNTFNWPVFKSKLIGYLINGMIWFDIYEYKKDSTEFTLMPNVCEELGNHLIKHINPANIYSVYDSTIPENVRKFAKETLRLENEDLKYRMKKISEILNMGCEIYTKQIAGQHNINDSWTKNGKTFNIMNSYGLKDTEKDNIKAKVMARLGLSGTEYDAQIDTPRVQNIVIEEIEKIKGKHITDFTRKPAEGYDEAVEYNVPDDYDMNMTNQDKFLYHYTNFGYALKNICMTNGNYKEAGFIIGFSMRHLGKVVSLFAGFEHYVIESMYTPIIQIIDKYIIQRYQGSREFSTNTNDLLQGGDEKENLKREAGSVFDIVEPHDPIESEIITQAVPFYISAYVILNYYVNHYAKGEDDMQLKLSISSISPLSDFKEKIMGQQNFKIADEQELKQFVSIMNEYWNSTVAENDKEKVCKAIEHIISELNSMLIFGNEEKVIRLQESGLDESHLDIYTINFQKIRETLIKTIDEATMNFVRKGVNNNAAVEGYFKKKTNEVKAATPLQRIGILKQILYDVYDPNKQDANNEYSSFIDLCVSPMFIINEIYKNVVDLTKFTFEKDFEIDTKAITSAQLNQTKDFNKLALIYYEKGYKTVGEIINHLFDEYYRDFDQTLHNIMNFPGLSDGQIKAFLDNIHDNFKSITEEAKTKIKTSNTYRTIESSQYIKDKILIPDTEIPTKLLQDIYVDETIFTPDTEMFANKEAKSFTQFVINVIASLSPSCFVPQIFSDLIKPSSLVNNTFEVMTKPKYNKKTDSYNPYEGKCLSTYIMCLSSSQTNNLVSNQMTQTIANKYVSAIPMLIAILTKCSSVLNTNATYKVLLEKKGEYTNYQNINARTEIGILIDILAKTYNDILPYSGEIQFMNGSTTTFSHYLSEIRYQITNGNVNFKTFIQQPEKYEWIFERACPELKIRYKTFDRFTDYKAKFAVMLGDITFSKQFDILLNILAKNIFRTLFLSITYDPETSGNGFTGRMLGGSENVNINTILNAIGLPNTSDESFAKELLCNLDNDIDTNFMITSMFDNTAFISMLNELRDKINIISDRDNAYAHFVNNTLEGHYPMKDTVSIPYGLAAAINECITNDDLYQTLANTFNSAIPVKLKLIKVLPDNELIKAIKASFEEAGYTKSEVSMLKEYIINTYNNKSNNLDSLIVNQCEVYLANTPGKIEKYTDKKLNKVIIPIDIRNISNDATTAWNSMLRSLKENEVFEINNPFDNAHVLSKISNEYKNAYRTFDFNAIIKGWYEYVKAKHNFSFKDLEKDEKNLIAFNGYIEANKYKGTDDLSKPIGFLGEKVEFTSLCDLILELTELNDFNETYMPPCKGFWNLFALPTLKEAKKIESSFIFKLSKFDGYYNEINLMKVNDLMQKLMVLTDKNAKDPIDSVKINNYTKQLISSMFSKLSGSKHELWNADGLNDEEVLTMFDEFLRLDKSTKMANINDIDNFIKNCKETKLSKVLASVWNNVFDNIKNNLSYSYNYEDVKFIQCVDKAPVNFSTKQIEPVLAIPENVNIDFTPAQCQTIYNIENSIETFCLIDGGRINLFGKRDSVRSIREYIYYVLQKVFNIDMANPLGADSIVELIEDKMKQINPGIMGNDYGVKLPNRDDRHNDMRQKIFMLSVYHAILIDNLEPLFVDCIQIDNKEHLVSFAYIFNIITNFARKEVNVVKNTDAEYKECLCSLLHNYKVIFNNKDNSRIFNNAKMVAWAGNSYTVNLISLYRAFVDVALFLNNEYRNKFEVIDDSQFVEIFEDIYKLRDYYNSLVSEETDYQRTTEKQKFILISKMYSLLRKYRQFEIDDELYNQTFNEIETFINTVKINPKVDLSYNFIIQPLTCAKLALESLKIIKSTYDAEKTINTYEYNTSDIKEQKGEISQIISKTLDSMEDNFANLATDSLMVRNMSGGDLEDVDSSVLLNAYTKGDNRFKKFLSTGDAKLETMIIAYFNKPLLSFNTYFNKNVFVEIIYNSALFKSSLMKIHEQLKGEQNKYWSRLIDAVFAENAIPKPESEDGVWRTRGEIKSAEIDIDGSIYGSITQPSTNRKFFEYEIKRENEKIYSFLNRVQGDGLTKLLLKIDACNEAVGTLAQWIKNFTFTNVEYNDEETFTKYDYDHEPFSY